MILMMKVAASRSVMLGLNLCLYAENHKKARVKLVSKSKISLEHDTNVSLHKLSQVVISLAAST